MKRFLEWLVANEIWLVGLLVGLGVASTRALPLAVAVLALFWLLRRLVLGHFSRRTALDIPVLILLVMLFVSLWVTALPELTRVWVWRILMSVGVCYSLVNWLVERQRLKLIWFGIFLALIGLSVLALFSVAWTTAKLPFIPQALYQRFVLALPDTVHPNIMGGILALLVGVALGLLLFSWREWGLAAGLFSWLALSVGLVLLLLTQSRGAMLGLGMATLLLLALRWRWGRVVLAVSALSMLPASLFYGQRIAEFFTGDTKFAGTVITRVEIWQRAIDMIRDFPFTGIGIGSFMQVAEALYPFFSAAPGTIPHAHNLLLQVAVDLGLPGLLAWLAAFILVCLMSWQVYRRGLQSGDMLAAGLGAGLLAFQVVMLVHGMVDVVVMSRPVTLAWGVWGLAAAAWRIFVAEPAQPNPESG